MKDIVIRLAETDVHRGDEIRGTVTVGFPGRYDGVMINVQILDSNELIHYTSYNGRKVSQHTTGLFVNRDHMPDNRIEFAACIDFEPRGEHEVKFRVTIIEQHKEVASDIIFARYL